VTDVYQKILVERYVDLLNESQIPWKNDSLQLAVGTCVCGYFGLPKVRLVLIKNFIFVNCINSKMI
jgi:hypothetical protein